MSRIPEVVSHADFLTAVKPLIDLLNISPGEAFFDLHVTPGGNGAVGQITCAVAAREEGDESERPALVRASEVQAGSVLAYVVRVVIL
jgi:hypothetical protein